MLGFDGDYTPGVYNFKIQDALAGAASVPYSKDKQLGKNFAVFIVGADLRVGPRYHVVHRGRGRHAGLPLRWIMPDYFCASA